MFWEDFGNTKGVSLEMPPLFGKDSGSIAKNGYFFFCSGSMGVSTLTISSIRLIRISKIRIIKKVAIRGLLSKDELFYLRTTQRRKTLLHRENLKIFDFHSTVLHQKNVDEYQESKNTKKINHNGLFKHQKILNV